MNEEMRNRGTEEMRNRGNEEMQNLRHARHVSRVTSHVSRRFGRLLASCRRSQALPAERLGAGCSRAPLSLPVRRQTGGPRQAVHQPASRFACPCRHLSARLAALSADQAGLSADPPVCRQTGLAAGQAGRAPSAPWRRHPANLHRKASIGPATGQCHLCFFLTATFCSVLKN